MRYTMTFTIPNDPSKLNKINAVLDDCCDLKSKIELHKFSIKDAIESLSEEFDIPKATLNKIVTMRHKRNKDDEYDKVQELHDLYDKLAVAKNVGRSL